MRLDDVGTVNGPHKTVKTLALTKMPLPTASRCLNEYRVGLLYETTLVGAIVRRGYTASIFVTHAALGNKSAMVCPVKDGAACGRT